MRVLALVSLVAAAACGSPYPSERVTAATAAMRAATEVDAAKEAPAAATLERARREMAEAQQLLADGHNRAAESLLIRAEADANLAAAQAREAPVRRDAQRVRERVEAIRAKNRM